MKKSSHDMVPVLFISSGVDLSIILQKDGGNNVPPPVVANRSIDGFSPSTNCQELYFVACPYKSKFIFRILRPTIMSGFSMWSLYRDSIISSSYTASSSTVMTG